MRIRLLSVDIGVESDDARVVDDLAGLMRGVAEGGSDQSAVISDQCQVRVVREGETWRIIRNGEPIIETPCYPYIIACLLSAVYREAFTRTPDYLVLHAAAAACGDAGLLLPGDKGVGKTTLAATLTAHGFLYYTDEMAPLEVATGRLVPFARPLNIKADTEEVLRPLGDRVMVGPYTGARADYRGLCGRVRSDLVGTAPVPVKQVVFARYVPGAETRLAESSKGKAVLDITRQAFNFNAFEEKAVALVSEIVRSAGTWSLEYSDVNAAAQAVHDLCQS
ncbi:hypothetical protein ACFLQU_02015, partial [Verrucomicrobiota bacterium]